MTNAADTSETTTTEGKITEPPASGPAADAGTTRRPDCWEGRNVEVDAEGYAIDLDSGEVLGHADEAAGEEPFRVNSPEAADWVLNLLATEEARLKAIEMRKAALLANLELMTVEHRNRVAWLHRRFDAELVAQARADIEAGGGKGKTAKYPHGKVAFRTTGGSAQITEPGLALAYVEEWAPSAVKKTVGIEAVRAAITADREANEEEPDVAAFFKAATPKEGVAITTGIGKETDK